MQIKRLIVAIRSGLCSMNSVPGQRQIAMACKKCGHDQMTCHQKTEEGQQREPKQNQQQQQTKTRATSNGMVRPNESTKISTNHLLAPLQEMFIDITLFSSVKAAHRGDCTLCKCCAKGRRVFLEMSSFESTILISADVGITRQVRCDSPATNRMLDGGQIHHQQLGGFWAVSSKQTLS